MMPGGATRATPDRRVTHTGSGALTPNGAIVPRVAEVSYEMRIKGKVGDSVQGGERW